jgi:hypothetical protein
MRVRETRREVFEIAFHGISFVLVGHTSRREILYSGFVLENYKFTISIQP